MQQSQILKQSSHNGIILTEQERQKIHYVYQVKEMLIGYDWDYFLTLTFKHPVRDRIKAARAIEKFVNSLSSKAYGSRSNKRILSFSAVEYDYCDGSLHVHMMIQDPSANILNDEARRKFNLRDAVIESWLQASSSAGNPALSAANDGWIKRIDNVRTAVDYMTKQMDPKLSSESNPIAWDQLSLEGRRIRY